MRVFSQNTSLLLCAIAFASAMGIAGAKAEDPSAAVTYKDIQATLGTVPGFFKVFPEAGIAGAWAEIGRAHV